MKYQITCECRVRSPNDKVQIVIGIDTDQSKSSSPNRDLKQMQEEDCLEERLEYPVLCPVLEIVHASHENISYHCQQECTYAEYDCSANDRQALNDVRVFYFNVQELIVLQASCYEVCRFESTR